MGSRALSVPTFRRAGEEKESLSNLKNALDAEAEFPDSVRLAPLASEPHLDDCISVFLLERCIINNQEGGPSKKRMIGSRYHRHPSDPQRSRAGIVGILQNVCAG